MSVLSPEPAVTQSAEPRAPGAESQPVAFRDRSTPMWAMVISALFSLGSGFCLLAVAVFVAFFYEQVAISGQTVMAALLMAGAMVPLLGMVIFEVGHGRALSGFGDMRRRHGVVGRAIVGVFACAVFSFLNPLLMIPFAICALMSWLLCGFAARRMAGEPKWAFLPQEAVAFLSGRDQRAVDLANAPPQDGALLDASRRAVALCGLIGSFALGSWLVAQEVINIAAMATIALITGWSADAFAVFFRQAARCVPELAQRAASVRLLPAPYSLEEDDTALVVSHLSLRDRHGKALLCDVSFRAEPGTIIGLSGDSFAGKSLLFKALQAPHDLTDLSVEGYVALHAQPLWTRSAEERSLSSVLVPPTPVNVPGSGAQNLTCFLDGDHVARARRALQQLVFTADTVDHIQNVKDVRQLSITEQKALSLARALALRPSLYLFDRPEDGASESLLVAFGQKLRADARLGHITLMITENRQLLDQCDHLLMMQNGRVIEFAPTKDIHARQATGWNRFVIARDLDSEEALDGWICSHFRRDGDEANRRAVCMVANELLSLACQSDMAPPVTTETVTFEFKHFVGKCQLRIIDQRLALSSGALQKAREAAETSVDGERLSPLAKIMRDSLEVQSSTQDGDGTLLVSVKTYDPRLLPSRTVSQDATAKR